MDTLEYLKWYGMKEVADLEKARAQHERGRGWDVILGAGPIQSNHAVSWQLTHKVCG